MALRLQSIFKWIDSRNTALLIFVLAMANFFGFTLEGGEEQYFAFAKQYMDPGWMPNSFTLNHPAGANMAFQTIVGFLLRFLTFEQVVVIGRTISFLMYAFPLACIFRKLRITNIEALFLLQVVFFSHQSLYAGEWIFKNFEEKTIAYLFVFWSLNFLLDDKPVISAIFAAFATYFHLLVGGWMFCFAFLFILVRRKKILPVILTGTAYVIITIPYMLYLFQTYFNNNPAVINGINTNAVYAYWRLKHHIGIFHDFHYFITTSLWGVLITLVFFFMCVKYFHKIKNQQVHKLNTLNIIVFIQQFVFMIVAIFDKNGTLMKVYPFRTNSLSVFLFLLEITLVVKYTMANRLYPYTIRSLLRSKVHYIRKAIFSDTFNVLLLLVFIPVFIFESADMIRNISSLHGDLDKPMLQLVAYVKKNTPGYSVFLFPDSDRPYSFIRRAERERFVVQKFTPTRSAAIYEWYNRSLLKEKIRNDISVIDSAKNVYQIDYLVSDSLYAYPSLELQKIFGRHKLYRIIP